jgi:hypothetical protein
MLLFGPRQSEIFPLNIRGQAASVATMANWLSNFFVSLTFLSLLNGLGNVLTFLLPVSGIASPWCLKLNVFRWNGLNAIYGRGANSEN